MSSADVVISASSPLGEAQIIGRHQADPNDTRLLFDDFSSGGIESREYQTLFGPQTYSWLEAQDVSGGYLRPLFYDYGPSNIGAYSYLELSPDSAFSTYSGSYEVKLKGRVIYAPDAPKNVYFEFFADYWLDDVVKQVGFWTHLLPTETSARIYARSDDYNTEEYLDYGTGELLTTQFVSPDASGTEVEFRCVVNTGGAFLFYNGQPVLHTLWDQPITGPYLNNYPWIYVDNIEIDEVSISAVGESDPVNIEAQASSPLTVSSAEIVAHHERFLVQNSISSTSIGTPSRNTFVQAVGFVPTFIPLAYFTFGQVLGAASAQYPQSFGTAYGFHLQPPPLENLTVSASGANTTAWGVAAATTDVSAQASGAAHTTVGQPKLRTAYPASGTQFAGLGAQHGLRLIQTGLGFSPTNLPAPYGALARVVTSLQPTARFGKAKTFRPNVYPAYGLSTTRYGSPRATQFFGRQAQGWQAAALGEPLGYSVLKARMSGPSTRIGRATLRRAPVC
jgi:hypothetical protein